MELTAEANHETGCPKLKFEPGMRRLLDGFLTSCKHGQAVKVKITRLRASKTDQQNRMIWGLLIATIKACLDDRGIDLGTLMPSANIPEGQPVPRDVIMQILYATCNDVGDQGERKTLGKMDVVETSRFFEKCRNYVASAWGIIVPDPDQNWREKL